MSHGVRIELHFVENAKHGNARVENWLFDAARWVGISGGVIYQAFAGFGRHGELRDGGIFDLDGRQPMMASFITSPLLAQKFLDYLEKEGLELFYTRSAVEFGVVGDHHIKPIEPADKDSKPG